MRCCCLLVLVGCESVFPLDYTLPDPCGTDPNYEAIVGVDGVLDFHRYRYVGDNETWAFAQASCVSEGGHLAVPETLAELIAIQERMAANGIMFGAWVGVARELDVPDPEDPASFRFITGDPIPFSLWGNGEPSNAAGDFPELVGEVTSAARLNDKDPTEGNSFVCECDNLDVETIEIPQ